MENIIAFFRNRHDMEKAAEALLKQGVINLKREPAASNPEGELPVTILMGEIGMSGETAAKLQVVVESSRRRQAEDTISKYGGEY